VERIIRNLDLPPFKKTVLGLYYMIKKFSTSDTQILDLDPSVVTLEYVPLQYQKEAEQKEQKRLKRDRE